MQLQKSAKNISPRLALRDPDIREILLGKLKKTFPPCKDNLILEEFGCNSARIDVAVVNCALHGFEIKSDCDSLERLDLQIDEYGRIFDYVTLISGSKLFNAAIDKIPAWWGIKLAISSGDSTQIRDVRQPEKNLHCDPLSLAKMLWKRETIQCLRRFGFKEFSAKQPAQELWSEIAQLFPKEHLAAEVRSAIKKRGGSGFEWLRTQNGGLSTTASTVVRHQYRQNLDWLLSLK